MYQIFCISESKEWTFYIEADIEYGYVRGFRHAKKNSHMNKLFCLVYYLTAYQLVLGY